METQCAIISSRNAPLYASIIFEELTKKHIIYDCYTWEDLSYNSVLNINKYSTVIILDSLNCPAFLVNDVSDYLKQGGNVVTLGGPPFKNEYYNINNKDIDIIEIKKMMQNGCFDKTVILPLDKSSDLIGFKKDTYNPDSKKYDGNATLSIVEDGITSTHCLKYYTDDFFINESFEKEIKIKEGHNVIGFYAKAIENTKTITIQLIQNNGDMFKTRITPSTQFEYFMLSKKDFIYSGNRLNNDIDERPKYVNFNKVTKIQFGHALSHAYSVAGEHAFFLNELSSANISVLNDERIIIDGLYPEYKFYPVTNAHSLRTYDKQVFISEKEFDVPNDLFSLSPRAQSSGFNKNRKQRFIPLIEAYDEKGLHCGYAAFMMLNISYCDRISNENKSSIIAFTTNNSDFYQNGGATSVAETILSLHQDVVLIEGGAEEYIYFSDTEIATYGCVIQIRNQANLDEYRIRITVGNISRTYDINEFSMVENTYGLDLRRISFDDCPTNESVIVALIRNEKICDIISHDICIYENKPTEERKFAYIKPNENEVYIDNKPVRFFGVNYMPSSSAGIEDFEQLEHYVSGFAYDPDIIETDLKRIKDIGMNSVSIFMHYNPSINSYNILHLISLCQKHGLYVDLSIRPNANPFEFNEQEVKEMITKYRFNENDTIVAYDIAWERYVGTYKECYGNFNGRKSFDEKWREFLINRYGSFNKAQEIFECELPKNEQGEVIGVSDDMLREDGKHNVMVAVFRHFIDEQVALAHINATQFIKSIDNNHMISARTGDASTIPLVDPGIYGYDYKALSSSLNFMSPESYALSDNYSSMRQGIFTNIYSRYGNKDNVIQWKEFGKSIWIGSNFIDNKISYNFQADYYRNFFDMLITGHTSGLYAWWWVGGYRVGENSDFGIVNPDGSDRPVTKVFREYSDKFLNAPALRKPEKQIYIDRDLHSDGLLSMYQTIERDLFGTIESGLMVELIDGGFNKSSADVDLIEVGNTPANGTIPKYLNGLIVDMYISGNDFKLSKINNGDTINIGSSSGIKLEVKVINTEKSVWICGDDFGSVSLSSLENSDFKFKIPLTNNIKSLEFTTFSAIIPISEKGVLSFALNAKDRTYFGEKIYITLK